MGTELSLCDMVVDNNVGLLPHWVVDGFIEADGEADAGAVAMPGVDGVEEDGQDQ